MTRTERDEDFQRNREDLEALNEELRVSNQELMETEHELREVSERYRSYIENAPFGVFIADENGRYVEVNPAACSISGYSQEELLSMRILDLLPEEDAQLGAEHFRQVVELGHAKGELSFKHKSGQIRIWSVDAVRLSPKRFMGFVADITEHRKAEDELSKSEDRFQKMLHAIPDMISVQDADMNILYSNWHGFAAVPEEKRRLGTKCHKTYRGYDDFCPDCIIRLIFELKKPVQGEMELPDGRWLDISAIPVLNTRGECDFFVEWARDITDQKKEEEERRIARENAEWLARQAEAANRAKSAFLANVSHEIRTPLNGVLGFLELLEDSLLDERQREYTGYAKASAHSLLTIVSNILDIANIEADRFELKPVKTDLRKFMEQTLAFVRSGAAKKGLDLRLAIGENIPRNAMLDAPHLKQVIGNLLGNAVKFTENGFVELSLIFKKRSEYLGDFTFSVRDTGIGIKPEERNSVLEPFYQTDASNTRQYEGTGLGLAIVNGILKKIGSALEFESFPGQGSRFFFTIRAEYTPDKSEVRKEEPGSSLSVAPRQKALPARIVKQNPVILVVEDVKLNRALVCVMLSKLAPDALLLEASDGEKGVSMFRHHTPDIVFMDLQMPVKDGYTAAREIRALEEETGRRTPIVALTADVQPDAKKASLANGMDCYLTKPLDRRTLRETLERFLGEEA